jgi:L-asparaginase II
MTTVVFTRGGLAESVHDVAWCATGPGGEIAATGGRGARDLSTFPRSAAKPLQALPAVRAGVLERFGLDARHLALACASHGGTAGHLAIAREMLAACGRSEDDLECGPLEPRDPAALAEMHANGGRPTRLVHNCSGKHALGIALCVAEDWPVAGYVEAGHPLQQAMHAAVADAASCRPERVPYGSDGCGMLAFSLPLARLAEAFGRLAAGSLGPEGTVVADAMRAHPVLVAFDGALDTELMRAEPGLVAKIGADGVLAVGLPDGRGLAVKVRDGSMRAIDPAGVLLVREVLGVPARSEALDALARPAITNSRGAVVGDGEARL